MNKWSSREYRLQYLREWRKKHPKHSTKWKREHLERARETERKWKREHPEKVKAIQRRYYLKHRDEILERQKERKKRIYNSDLPHTIVEKVLERDNRRCQKCGKPYVKGEPFAIHHINWDKDDNRLENLVFLCSSCHYRLHNLTRAKYKPPKELILKFYKEWINEPNGSG